MFRSIDCRIEVIAGADGSEKKYTEPMTERNKAVRTGFKSSFY